MWTIAFMLTFVHRRHDRGAAGGAAGGLRAAQLLFLVAHFHNVIIGGVVFGLFAAINYWFPKAFGFAGSVLGQGLSFWCWVVGFWVAFMPLYMLGLMGVTRRMNRFEDPSLQILFA
jgi:cytochrome o ubiquinol oxidase subunit 1